MYPYRYLDGTCTGWDVLLDRDHDGLEPVGDEEPSAGFKNREGRRMEEDEEEDGGWRMEEEEERERTRDGG